LIGTYLPTFRNSLSVPSSRVMQSKKFLDCMTLEDRTGGCTETSVTNYQSRPRNIT
jgi:hypothetical protein